jgi:NAD(P)-dependent dehydrogenase (short-subunit alcohol dehydrogenase family)
MQGKTIVITGATSGIGRVAAQHLAEMGARIILVAREKSRMEATLDQLRAAAPTQAHGAYLADLCKISEVKRVGAEIAAAEPPIDVLINNAGALFAFRTVTEDGLEKTFALNHMAYFVLTEMLRDRLVAAGEARIVNTSSAAHLNARLDLDDLQCRTGYGAMKAYGRSKLCNILFTRELARRLAGTKVTANCLHPGFVATRFGDEAGGLISRFAGLAKLLAVSPEDGAKTLVYLASSPHVARTTGRYFYLCRPLSPSRAAEDEALATELWERSVVLAGLSGHARGNEPTQQSAGE